MKQILAAACACLALVFAGCSGSKASAGFSESDLMLQVNGNSYLCRVNIEQVISDLGDSYEYAEGKSCNYDGLDKTYTFEEAAFYTNPMSEGDLVKEIYTENSAVATSKGLTVGVSRQVVLDAYGSPTEQEESLLIYRISDENGQPSLCFELEDETVAAIYLTLERV